MFIIVGYKRDSSADELWEIYGDEPEFGPLNMQNRFAERELRALYGSALASAIMAAYEDGSMREITGAEKRRILRRLDMDRLESRLIVYELLVGEYL